MGQGNSLYSKAGDQTLGSHHVKTTTVPAKLVGMLVVGWDELLTEEWPHGKTPYSSKSAHMYLILNKDCGCHFFSFHNYWLSKPFFPPNLQPELSISWTLFIQLSSGMQ